MNGKEWVRRLAGELEYASDSPVIMPLIEICGEKRVLIEHHQGVTQYAANNVCVKVAYGRVEIHGENLRLMHMTGSKLVVSGRIDSVRLLRRC